MVYWTYTMDINCGIQFN